MINDKLNVGKDRILTLLSLFYTIFGWVFFIILVTATELTEFINITLSVYANVDYYNGLIYPTPFLSGDARSTRALLLRKQKNFL